MSFKKNLIRGLRRQVFGVHPPLKMTARLASVSKCLELYWVCELWAQLFTDNHQAAICESASAGGARVPLTAALLATWKASSSFQGIYHGLMAGDSVTGGTTPAPLPLCHRRAQHPDRLTLRPMLQGSTYPWDPVCNHKGPFHRCCYHLAFSTLHAQDCPFAEVSDEPLQMPFLEARTVIKGAGTQPQRLPASSITSQDDTNDLIKRCCSQESWLGLTLRKRPKFPMLLLLFCSCVSSFVLFSCFY